MSDLHRNSRQLLQKRYRQIDPHLRTVLRYLAEMRRTLNPRDCQYAGELFEVFVSLDVNRQHLLDLYRRYCGGPEDDLRQVGDVIEILETAGPLTQGIRG